MAKLGYNNIPRGRIIAVTLICLLILIHPVKGYAAVLLRLGNFGDDIRVLQNQLLSSGFHPGPIDGIFGPRTHAAVIDFQKASGLAVDGIVGPATWQALERASQTYRGTGILSRRTIVIDPGHGGVEPGAISVWGDKEKDFTLAIASKVRHYLEDLGAIVVMTRYGDSVPGSDWVPPVDDLLARVSVANSREADLFLSIHINAYPKDSSVSGVMGFYQGGSWNSQQLANILANNVSNSTGLDVIDIQRGPYYVLNNTYMSAVLMEIGFMTNWDDVTLLRQNWFQDAVAKALARGVAEFLVR